MDSMKSSESTYRTVTQTSGDSTQATGTVTVEDLYTCRPTAIWKQVRTEPLCFWFICGYLFFEYVRPQSIYLWLDFFPWASTFVVLALATSLVDRTSKPQGNLLNKLLVIYGIIVLLSAAFAQRPSLSYENLGYFFNWLVIYFAIVRIVHTRARFFVFLLLFLLCSYKMSQHGFVSWASRGFGFASWGVTGSPGWFRNSGEFGIQLTIFTPLSIAFILALRSRWNRIAKAFFYLMPVTAIGSTIATSSRASLLGLIGAGTWSIKATRYFVRTIVALVILAGVVWWATPQQFKDRFDAAGDDRTSETRLFLWEHALETIGNHPLLGVGHKNWEAHFRATTGVDESTAMVHNIFLQSATEHGLLGLGTFILILLMMFRLNALTRRCAKEHDMRFEYYLSHGMDAAIVGMIISSSFVTVLYYPFVWVHSALCTCLYNSTRKPSARSRSGAKSEAPQRARKLLS